MNSWGIPKEIEDKVKARDHCCVYCHVTFSSEPSNVSRRNKATWEHINNDRWNDQSIMWVNIALCCTSCNSSKGRKNLRSWFTSDYCIKKSINEKTVADCVKIFLKEFPE